jgi:hypothetical protein
MVDRLSDVAPGMRRRSLPHANAASSVSSPGDARRGLRVVRAGGAVSDGLDGLASTCGERGMILNVLVALPTRCVENSVNVRQHLQELLWCEQEFDGM